MCLSLCFIFYITINVGLSRYAKIKMVKLHHSLSDVVRPETRIENVTYSCLSLAMRGVFVNFVVLLTRNTVAKRCVFADLYT